MKRQVGAITIAVLLLAMQAGCDEWNALQGFVGSYTAFPGYGGSSWYYDSSPSYYVVDTYDTWEPEYWVEDVYYEDYWVADTYYYDDYYYDDYYYWP